MSFPAASPSTPRVILPIQYLRGIAAMMVVWFHAAEQLPRVKTLIPNTFGNSGVDLFFVISGFIMVITTTGSAISPVEFMRRRIIRVAPLYWLLTLAMVGAALAAPALFRTLIVTPTTLVESLLFVPHFSNSFPTMAWPLLVPGWTLNFEMFFYLVFALSLALPGRWRVIGLAGVFAALVSAGLLFGPFDAAAARVYTSLIMLEFVAGAALAKWWLQHRTEPPRAISAIAIVLGFALLLARDSAPLGTGTQMTGAVLIVFGALNAAFAGTRLPLLRALGDSSYSLYLTHLFTLGALRAVWVHVAGGSTGMASIAGFMATGLVLCAAVGYASWRWLETPLTRRLLRIGRP